MTILSGQSVISRVYTSRFGNGTARWNLDRSGTKKVSGTRYSTQWKTPQKWTLPYRTVPYHAVEKRHKISQWWNDNAFLSKVFMAFLNKDSILLRVVVLVNDQFIKQYSICEKITYWVNLVSSSRHWWLHIEQPQAQHPPTSTHYCESTSPPDIWDLLVSDASWYITERLKITLQNILVHRSWLVEWSSHPYPECWIPVNLQATTEN